MRTLLIFSFFVTHHLQLFSQDYPMIDSIYYDLKVKYDDLYFWSIETLAEKNQNVVFVGFNSDCLDVGFTHYSPTYGKVSEFFICKVENIEGEMMDLLIEYSSNFYCDNKHLTVNDKEMIFIPPNGDKQICLSREKDDAVIRKITEKALKNCQK